MKQYLDVARDYTDALTDLYDVAECRQLFLMAYTFITGKKAVAYSLESSAPVDGPLQQRFAALLRELQMGRPIQHLIGEADFFGLRFLVNEHTLIPRSETEELVDWIIKDQRHRPSLSVLDVGTGSGCIALAIAKHLPQAQVHALDVSSQALAVARDNAKRLSLSVNFIEADVLEWDAFMQPQQRYDIIVSNPPYITPQEQQDMHVNVLRYEPHTALFVEEHSPLLFYDAVADLGRQHLTADGALYFEINQYLGPQTQDLLVKKGYQHVALRQDLNQVDRMIKAQR